METYKCKKCGYTGQVKDVDVNLKCPKCAGAIQWTSFLADIFGL